MFSPRRSASGQRQQEQLYRHPFEVQAEQVVPPWLAGIALGVDDAMLREGGGGVGSSYGLLSDMMEEELQQTGRGGRTLRRRGAGRERGLGGDGMNLILNVDKRKKRTRQQRDEDEDEDEDGEQQQSGEQSGEQSEEQSGSGGDEEWEQALFCPFCDAVCSSQRDIERHVNRDCPACPRDDGREEKTPEEIID